MPARQWYDLRPLPASVGDWLTARPSGESIVPPGFPAYVTVPNAAGECGNLGSADLAASLREVLALHCGTRTCVAGLWDGFGMLYGGITGSWADGVAFPPEVMGRPRFEFGGRQYLLFEAELADLDILRIRPETPGWLAGRSPNLFWPQDHAWLLLTDADRTLTAVCGTADLAQALVDRLGARRVEPSS